MQPFGAEPLTRAWAEELFPGGGGGGDTYKGNWSAGTTYQAGDIVFWDHGLYRATATTSVLSPVPVGSPTTAQTGDTTIAIPAGAVPGDLMLISIAWPQAVPPMLFPDLFSLIGQGAAVTGVGSSVANTIAFHQLDSGDIAAGSFALQDSGGNPFVAWGSLFRNARVLEDLAGAPYYTNASTGLFFETVISALTGVGAVTTTASGDPQEAHGLASAGVNASFIAAIGWSVSNPETHEPLFFITDDGVTNPSLKNTLAAIAILPPVYPTTFGQPWALYADAIPLGDSADAPGAIVIGSGAYALSSAQDAMVIGGNASALGYRSVAIGNGASANGDKCVVIGLGSAAGLRSIAIGDTGGARSDRGVVLGYGAIVGGVLPSGTSLTDAQDGIAIGTDAYAGDQYTIAIGTEAFANHVGNADAIAIGHNASLSSSPLGIAIGANTSVNALAGVALGQASTVTGSYGVAIGGGTAADSSIAIGTHNTSAQATGLNSIAVGGDAQALALGSAAFGIGATAQGTYGLSIGYTAAGTGGNAIAIGKLAQGGGVNSLAIGLSASASGSGSVAIGTDSSGAGAAATATNEVSLGMANHQVRVRGTLRVDRAKQSTVGAAGGASALPATPSGYVPITASDGTEYVVPIYNKV